MTFIGSRFFCIKYLATNGLKVSCVLSRRKSDLNCDLNAMPYLSPVKLAYVSHESAVEKSSNSQEAPPIIIIPGLLGSGKLWKSQSKAIHQRTNRKVIAVDVRNHGDSPHASEFTYDHMVEDIILLLKNLEIRKAVMVGHSMGARVTMFLALNYPEYVERLVSIDMSPINNGTSFMSMLSILEAMKSVTLNKNSSLSEAREMTEQQLSTTIKSAAIRQFLLTNLVQAKTGKYKWRVNLPVLEENYVTHVTQLCPTNKIFVGPTLFIGGGQSDYIDVNDHAKIKQLFPAAKCQYIRGAGHWVPTEKPREFLDMLVSFINET